MHYSSVTDLLWQHLPFSILAVNVDGVIIQANHAALALFSLSEAQITSQSVSDLIGFTTNELQQTQQINWQGQSYAVCMVPIPATPLSMIILSSLSACAAVKLAEDTLTEKKSSLQARKGDSLIGSSSAFDQFVSNNSQMLAVIEQAKKFAKLDEPLLITGDTGTGKDILALACHQYSQRGDKIFLALNCAALPDDVAESELFGHAPGAYPNAIEGKKGFFEQAKGGSVLLDEIGEMSPRMQMKLLRFINNGTFRRVGADDEVHVDVRVICATQRNLHDLVKRGIFREDLYYRLNVLPLNLPPLRERPQDIPLLVTAFMHEFARKQKVPVAKLDPYLTDYLQQYSWPGNVRQLKNVIYLALTQLEGSTLAIEHIVLPDFTSESPLAVTNNLREGTLDEMAKQFERSVITQLYATYPSTRKLAKRLGLSHTAIANKLREHGLNRVKGKAD